jgi:hypothetical protein
MKKVLIGGGVLLVVALIGIFVLLGNLDKIVKGAIEGVGSELLGVPLTVTAVELDVRGGRGQITGLNIGNPPGYKSPQAFKMDLIRLGISYDSIGKQPLVISELNIQNPVVELELKDDGSTNLQQLMNNMQQNGAKADQKAAEQQPDTGAVEKGEPARIAIKKLVIAGVTVKVQAIDEPVETVTLPDIVLNDVGRQTGLTPAEIGQLIVGEIINQSLAATIERKMTEKLEEGAKGLFEDLKKKFGQ